MRLSMGIPSDLEPETNHFKTRQLAFLREGDIIVQVWSDKRLVLMKSMIHDAAVVNTGRKDRTDLAIKKPHILFGAVISWRA
jgi:hypothetical protein